MGTLRRHVHRLSATAAVALILFATALGGTLMGAAQDAEETQGRDQQGRHGRLDPTRRQLIGPGSSPPTCRARCGRCSPCRPFRVAIHPGRLVPLEYYPEVWRCKCGDVLFMP